VLWLWIVVDHARTRIRDARGSGAQLTSLRVSPAVYDAVAAARPGEAARLPAVAPLRSCPGMGESGDSDINVAAMPLWRHQCGSDAADPGDLVPGMSCLGG
jgi:hypothetical protein